MARELSLIYEHLMKAEGIRSIVHAESAAVWVGFGTAALLQSWTVVALRAVV